MDAVTDPNEHEQVGHDVELTDQELMAQFPARQAALQMGVIECRDGNPCRDDVQMVFKAAAWNLSNFNAEPSEVLCVGWTENAYGRRPGRCLPSCSRK